MTDPKAQPLPTCKESLQVQPLTEGEIEAIRERESKATPGPWRHNKCGYVYGPDVVICEVGDFKDKELLPFNRERWLADSDVIAAVPRLLATIQAQAERIAELTEELEEEREDYADTCAERVAEYNRAQAAEARVAKLEAALAALDFEGEDDAGWNLDEAMKGVECGRRSRNLLERVRDQLSRARAALQGQGD